MCLWTHRLCGILPSLIHTNAPECSASLPGEGVRGRAKKKASWFPVKLSAGPSPKHMSSTKRLPPQVTIPSPGRVVPRGAWSVERWRAASSSGGQGAAGIPPIPQEARLLGPSVTSRGLGFLASPPILFWKSSKISFVCLNLFEKWHLFTKKNRESISRGFDSGKRIRFWIVGPFCLPHPFFFLHRLFDSVPGVPCSGTRRGHSRTHTAANSRLNSSYSIRLSAWWEGDPLRVCLGGGRRIQNTFSFSCSPRIPGW